MATENKVNDIESPKETVIHFLKYEQSIYILAVFGAISQIVVVCVIIGHLVTGIGGSSHGSIFLVTDLGDKAIAYSAIGIVVLTGTAFSEILLMRAINQRFLRYIQWWMVSTLIIFIFCILMAVIAGFTLFKEALWITLGFCYMVMRLPFQIYFVDRFTYIEIIHKEPLDHCPYDSVLYRRFP